MTNFYKSNEGIERIKDASYVSTDTENSLNDVVSSYQRDKSDRQKQQQEYELNTQLTQKPSKASSFQSIHEADEKRLKTKHRKRKKLTEDIIYKLANQLTEMIENTADELKTSDELSVVEDISNSEPKNEFKKLSVDTRKLNDLITNGNLDDTEDLQGLINGLKKNLNLPCKYLNTDTVNSKQKLQKVQKKHETITITKSNRREFKIIETSVKDRPVILKNEVINHSINKNNIQHYYSAYKDPPENYYSKHISSSNRDSILLPCMII